MRTLQEHAPELWAICRACGKTGNVTRVPNGRRLRCSRCGSYDYGLSINNPSKPVRPAQTSLGEIAANVRLKPLPEIDPTAWERGEYP